MAEFVTLFQYNTLGAFMAGLYKGTMTIAELLQHGDLGIGTLDSIDGELIVLDGKAYQVKALGEKTEVIEVSMDMMIPYAAVAFHQAEVHFHQDLEWTDEALKKRMEAYYLGKIFFTLSRFMGNLGICMCAWLQNPLQGNGSQKSQLISQNIMQNTFLEQLLVFGHRSCFMVSA